MREILFRGKRTDNGEWVYGYLANGDTIANCYDGFHSNTYEIDPATVGQYTGMHDKNGTMIFEGDIVNYKDDFNFEVMFKCGMFVLVTDVGCLFYFDGLGTDSLTILGNIHDNPDLIKQG